MIAAGIVAGPPVLMSVLAVPVILLLLAQLLRLRHLQVLLQPVQLLQLLPVVVVLSPPQLLVLLLRPLVAPVQLR